MISYVYAYACVCVCACVRASPCLDVDVKYIRFFVFLHVSTQLATYLFAKSLTYASTPQDFQLLKPLGATALRAQLSP